MKKSLITGVLALAVMLVASCTEVDNLDQVSAREVGTVVQLLPCTVVSARTVRIEASDDDKLLGTASGAMVGATAGSMIGKNAGNGAAVVGLGMLGAIAGHSIVSDSGKAEGQELVLKADKTRERFRITQPVYKQLGPIPVGTHGNLQCGGARNRFLPDGY